MDEKKKNNRRTKQEIAIDRTLKTLSDLRIDAESEEGRVMLQKIRDRYKNDRTTKTNPELSKAKKERLTAMRELNKLNSAARQIDEASKLLNENAIRNAIDSFNNKNKVVEDMGGEKMTAKIENLTSYMKLNEVNDEDN